MISGRFNPLLYSDTFSYNQYFILNGIFLFLKLPLVNDLNFHNGVDRRHSVNNGCFLQLTALVVQKSREALKTFVNGLSNR